MSDVSRTPQQTDSSLTLPPPPECSSGEAASRAWVESRIVAGVSGFHTASAGERPALPIVVIRDERDLERLVRDDSFVGPLVNAPASARQHVIQTIVDADANGRPLIAPATSGHSPKYRLTQKAVAGALGIDGKTFRRIRERCAASPAGPAPWR